MAIKNLYARSVTSSRLSTGVSTHISSGKGEDAGLSGNERTIKHLSEALSYIGGRIADLQHIVHSHHRDVSTERHGEHGDGHK